MTRRAGVLALAGLYIVLVLAWVVWGQLVAPDMITRAYRRDGFALLQRVLQAQGPRPLDEFVEFRHRSMWALAALWIGVGCVLSAATRPRLQRAWDSARGAAPEGRPAIDLGRRRLTRVRLFMSLLLAAQGTAIVSWLELWPFSPYKMFSETRLASDALTRYRVFGIPPLMLGLLSNSSIQRFAAQARRAADPERSLQAFAGAVLDLYEVGHRRATHHGSRLVGLRVYEDVWSQLDVSARARCLVVPAAYLMHVGIRLLFGANFLGLIVLYVLGARGSVWPLSAKRPGWRPCAPARRNLDTAAPASRLWGVMDASPLGPA